MRLQAGAAVTRCRGAIRGAGNRTRWGWRPEDGNTRAPEADAHQHQPGGREHDDHSQEPPVADHPGSVLKRPKDPHPRITLGDVPREMEHQSGRHPSQHGPVPATGRRGGGEHGHGGQRMCDRALALVPQQPEVQRYVIHIDGDRCDERRDIEAAGCVDEARQDEQAQAAVDRWATSSTGPVVHTPKGSLRSAASNASATATSSSGPAHHRIDLRTADLIPGSPGLPGVTTASRSCGQGSCGDRAGDPPPVPTGTWRRRPSRTRCLASSATVRFQLSTGITASTHG